MSSDVVRGALLHVSALHCHLQGGFLVPSVRCSTEKQLIEYCG